MANPWAQHSCYRRGIRAGSALSQLNAPFQHGGKALRPHGSTVPCWTLAGRTIFRPLVASAYVYARLSYGLDMELVAPERAVAKTQVPVLLIHGKNDTNIPVRTPAGSPLAIECGVWELPNTGINRDRPSPGAERPLATVVAATLNRRDTSRSRTTATPIMFAP